MSQVTNHLRKRKFTYLVGQDHRKCSKVKEKSHKLPNTMCLLSHGCKPNNLKQKITWTKLWKGKQRPLKTHLMFCCVCQLPQSVCAVCLEALNVMLLLLFRSLTGGNMIVCSELEMTASTCFSSQFLLDVLSIWFIYLTFYTFSFACQYT